jgi:hypothetical protein
MPDNLYRWQSTLREATYLNMGIAPIIQVQHYLPLMGYAVPYTEYKQLNNTVNGQFDDLKTQ